MTTLIEKMARAISPWTGDHCDERAMRDARAALAVVCEALREPSEEMQTAFWDAYYLAEQTGGILPEDIFRALAAYWEGESK